MGRHGLGCINDNGDRFANLCAFNDLVIGGNIFSHKAIHKATWISPDGRSSNQTDHIAIGRKWRRSLMDVRVKRRADVASDHHLLLGTLKGKLRAHRDLSSRPRYKYNTQNLKSKEIAETFSCSVKNRYSALEFVEEEIDSHWIALKHTWQESCDEVVGKRKRTQKEWLSAETWNLITQWKRLKVEISRCNEQAKKSSLTLMYLQLNKDVKKSAKKDKKEFYNTLATEAESAAGQRNMKRLYDITRTMSGKRRSQSKPVKSKEGVTITTEQEQRTRWVEHFRDILNRPPPTETPNTTANEGPLVNVNVNPPSKAEIERALKQLKNGKAAGPDGIPLEALKVDPKTTKAMLYPGK